MGDEFPLRFERRHHLQNFVYLLLGAVLFWVLPVAYLFSAKSLRDLSLQDWPLFVVLGAGFVMVLATIYSVFSRVAITIDAEKAIFEVFEPLVAKGKESVPLGEYSALLTSLGAVPGFIGDKPSYQIMLWHPRYSAKQVVLFFHIKKELFDERLAAYTKLFELPVNPESLKVVEIDLAGRG